MNRIVRHRYPASSLPAELREGIDPASDVIVTVEELSRPSRRRLTLEEILASRKPPYRSVEEIVGTVRRQRDEWDG
jgi:hypothetical protein